MGIHTIDTSSNQRIKQSKHIQENKQSKEQSQICCTFAVWVLLLSQFENTLGRLKGCIPCIIKCA